MTTISDKARDILLITLLYLSMLAAAHLLGFRMEIPWGYVQLLDSRLVSQHPAASLWYLHHQPPGFTAVFALVMNASRGLGASPESVAKLLFVAAGLLGAWLLFQMLFKLTDSRIAALAGVAVLLASPGYHLFANFFLYTFLLHLLLLALLWLAWRFLEEPKPKHLYAFAIVAAATSLTRSLYHPVWAVLVFSLLVGSAGWLHGWRGTLRVQIGPAAVLVLLLLSWPLKNYLVFDHFVYSSLSAYNLRIQLPVGHEPELDLYIGSGRVSPHMARRLRSATRGYSEAGRKLLLTPRKSDGSPNWNHLLFLWTNQDITRRAIAWRLSHIRLWLAKGIGQYWMFTRATYTESYEGGIRGPENSFYRVYAAAVKRLVFADLRPLLERIAPIQVIHDQAMIRGKPVPYTFFGAVLFPVTMVASLCLLLAGLQRRSPDAGAMAVAWFCVFWNLLVPCATYGFESNRMRFATLPLFLILLWYVMRSGWTCCAQRLRSPRPPPRSPRATRTSYLALSQRRPGPGVRRIGDRTMPWVSIAASTAGCGVRYTASSQ